MRVAWVLAAVLSTAVADECVEELHPPLEAVPGSSVCVGTHCVSRFVYYSQGLEVLQLAPNTGPSTGGTEVVVVANGVRDFGSLMRCRFADIEVQGRLVVSASDVNPAHNLRLACEAPPMHDAAWVGVEISLTGETFTSNALNFTYYQHPTLTSLSPSSVSTRGGETVSITGTGFAGTTESSEAVYMAMCRFSAVVDPNGQGQVPLVVESEATVVSDTAVQCTTPQTNSPISMTVQVALNGHDYSSSNLTLPFRDNWYTPVTSGSAPSAREYHATVFVPSPPRLVVLGGANGKFLDDVHVLHLDLFDSFYPSTTKPDLAWVDMSSSAVTAGDRPRARSQHAAVVIEGRIYQYGGVVDFHEQPSAELFVLQPDSLASGDGHVQGSDKLVYSSVSVNGSSPGPRALHSMVPANTTAGTQLAVFGGRSLVDCGFSNMCYSTHDDTWLFNPDSSSWSQLTTTNTPNPRAAHGAAAFNDGDQSTMWVFGGEVWLDTVTVSGLPYSGGLSALNDLHKLDVASGTWTLVHDASSLTSIPQARSAPALTAVGTSHLVLFGGMASDGITTLSDLWVFDTAALSWTQHTPVGPAARYAHTLTAVSPTQAILVGGMMDSGILSSDVYILDVEGAGTSLW